MSDLCHTLNVTITWGFTAPGIDSRWGLFSVVPSDKTMCPKFDFSWGKGGRCLGLTLVVPNVEMIRGLNLPGTSWATSACCGIH